MSEKWEAGERINVVLEGEAGKEQVRLNMQRKLCKWEAFRDAGLLWWINRILHTFGWAIVIAEEEDGEVVGAWPERVTYFGFTQETDEEKLDDFRAHIEHPRAFVEERLREERDRLRNEVVNLRGDRKHDYQPLAVELGETMRYRCTRCQHETSAPTHAYFNPCVGED